MYSEVKYCVVRIFYIWCGIARECAVKRSHVVLGRV